MADLTLVVSGVGATGQLNSVGAPGLMALTLPTPTLKLSAAGAIPLAQLVLPTPVLTASGASGALGRAALSLPTPQVFAGPQAALTLPVPVLAAAGSTGAAASVALALPTAQLVATGKVPVVGQLGLTLTPQLNASGYAGSASGLNLTLPVPQLVASGKVPVQADAALALPSLQLAAQGVTGVTGKLALTMRSLALAISGATGVVGTAQLVLPVMRLGVAAYEPMIGAVRLSLPMLRLVATGAQAGAAAAPAVSSTLVMHTETMGLTTYSNFPFNSFAAFNGVYLGASDAGLFVLAGDTDNGALIQAAARVGITDFATSYLKRVDRVYVGYRTTGDLVLRVFTDELTQRDYLLRATGDAGLHGNHARLGKGLEARYWSFEVRNVNGSDFELNMIELKPTKLRRRVGGRDA